MRDLELLACCHFPEVHLGGINISIVGILTQVLLFAVRYLVAHWDQSWLDNNVMARNHVHLGVRNPVRTGLGHLGVEIAAIIAISAAGINLSSFALVASALSVGPSFGL